MLISEMCSTLSYHIVQMLVSKYIGKILIQNSLYCRRNFQRFVVMLPVFYIANIVHYTAGILVNNVDELFRL